MVTSYAMRAAAPCIIWRVIPTRIPTRQAVIRAERQLQIRVRLAGFD